MSSTGVDGANGPLKGIRVLDWTIWQFGPVATSMMGDMGADVIKIESLDGDGGRGLRGRTPMVTGLPAERNAYFETLNRNKRGIALNLKTAEGVEVVHKLVKKADVFVQNFRQGVAERLGVDYETLKEINPMLVYGSGSGYGTRGPDAHAPSFDGCGQARGGLMMSATGYGVKEPSRIDTGVCDQIGGIVLCQGVLAALVARHTQGIGQKVDASHLSSTMWLQGMGIGVNLMLPEQTTGISPRSNPRNPLVNVYECADGRWIQLMHVQPDRYWDRVITAIGRPDLVDDERFTDMERRTEHGQELVEIMDRQFSEKSFDEWDALFRSEGDFIYAKVQSIGELQDDPQVIANDFITTFDHPVMGPVKMCNHPNVYSETPSSLRREAPELGQHTEEVLIEELDYSWDDIADLQQKGVIL